MLRALLRSSLALGGAAFATFLVALLEARAVTAGVAVAGGGDAPFGALVLGGAGVLAPVALGVGIGVGALLFLLDPSGTKSPGRALAALRGGTALDRLRVAAAAPAVVLAAFGWVVACAHLGRVAMRAEAPAEAGLVVGIGAVGAMLAAAALALACLPLLRRLLAVGSAAVPKLLDPAFTGSAALIIVLLLASAGVSAGDTSGGGGGVLGIFGVLKRQELDLRPVANTAVIALFALVAPFALARAPLAERARVDRGSVVAAAVGIALVAAIFGLCARAASRLGEPEAVASGIEEHAPVGKHALALLRRVTDKDKDGFSALFAGGDCDDSNPNIHPNALDIPGNGVDEDCSGADTPAPAPPEPSEAPERAVQKPNKTFNVILLTVDTLRPDVGFMGYKHPTTPNLDKVAEKATIFEQAYAMASYTGKSVGPMLIGRYPSETFRNFNHFTTYFDKNVFVTERLRDAGVRTFAAMCHWYFRNPTGLKQGFDVWDTSAIPPGGGDIDTLVTGDRMAELSLKLLAAPENVTGAAPVGAGDAPDGGPGAEASAPPREGPFRFFAWLHFLDPHAQYLAHKGAPDFSEGTSASRALYNQEIWYTDQQIGRVLDYVASQPWGDETAIILTSDHGEAFFEHGMNWHGREIWEELVHVPLFVYVPGAEPRRVAQKRSHIDLAPTILELMGVPLPEPGELRGTSLLDDVYLPEGAEHEERDVYIDMPEGPHNGPRRALIMGPSPGLKLTHSGGRSYRLFDLATDPGERDDLSGDKEKLNEAIARMSAFRARLEEIELKPTK